MGLRDRLRRLEDKFRDRGPSPEEVNAAFERLADSTRARLFGEPIDEGQAARDRDIISRWERASGVDLEIEAEQVREKLSTIGRGSAGERSSA